MGMNAIEESRDSMPCQRDAKAVEAEWRAVQSDMQVVRYGTPEGRRLKAEAARLTDEHGRLSDEANRHGRAVRPLPRRMTSTERHSRERKRIALQIRAVVVPYRIAQERQNPAVSDSFRARANMLLDTLEHAVEPHRDLQISLAAARAELAQGAG